MTPNSEYKELFERKEALEAQRYQILVDAQAELDKIYMDEWRKLHPRKKKVPEKYQLARELPEEIWKLHFERLKNAMEEKRQVLADQIENDKKRMFELSSQVEFSVADRDYELGSCNGGSYHTQGFGANRYAEGTLTYKREVLNHYGFTAKIDCVVGEWKKDAYGHGYQYNTYTLVANCEPWMWDALFLTKADWEQWEIYDWNHGVNPKVYTGGYGMDSDGVMGKKIVWKD